jgi:hypothetical protein
MRERIDNLLIRIQKKEREKKKIYIQQKRASRKRKSNRCERERN